MITKGRVGSALLLSVAATAVCSAIALAGSTPSLVSAGALSNNGKFYSDYTSLADAKAAASDLNVRLSEEGDVLLKNDGTLPLIGKKKVSVFGVSQDALVDAAGTIADSLSDAGFIVNPTLKSFYASDSSPIGSEVSSFSQTTINSCEIYDDAAVILLSRTGGEGSDAATVTTQAEDEKDVSGNSYGWTHAHLATGSKHYLELTDSEEALIAFAKKHFSKIAVVLNTSNAMEMYNLQHDDAINAILWVGRPGDNGIKAVGEILNGTVNPSGRMVDEWNRDFTADPTWMNFGDNSQMNLQNVYYYADGTVTGPTASSFTGAAGYHGIDYEEGIYLGYRYYETKYADLYKTDPAAAKAWWEQNVVYPFGYGLSYTSFSLNVTGLYKNASLTDPLGNNVSASLFSSAPGSLAQVSKLYVPVKVTNTGSKAGKETVEIYVTAPYTVGGIEKSFVTLVGFAKSDYLAPGASQTVVTTLNVQDMASYDYSDANHNGNKGYELDSGVYTVRAMSTSHVDLAAPTTADDDYDEVTFDITDTAANLILDDFSGNAVTNLFSKENGDFDSVREGVNLDGSSMTQMSRTNMDATFPSAPSKAERTMTDAFTNSIVKMDEYDADDTANYASEDATGAWASDVVVPNSWTQVASAATKNQVLLSAMAGKSLDDPSWVSFMNQLSWKEITNLISNGSYQTAAVPSIDKAKGTDLDGPNNLNSSYNWCDEPVIAATWNVELAKEQGIVVGNLGILNNVTGWYGPGMDTHRSPFGGRNDEYYSQDGILAGYIASSVVKAAESRGLNVYIKHFALNEQETNRCGEDCFMWLSEQAFREIYLKPFQMAMQEGGASACMSAFVRVGKIADPVNYNLLTALVRKQFGWKGYYVTDMWSAESKVAPIDFMIRAGNDLPLGSPSTASVMTHYDSTTDPKNPKEISITCDRTCSGTWDATLRSNQGGVVVGTAKTQSDAQYFFARTAAQRVLYNAVNSANNRNGTTMSKYAGKDLGNCQQGVAVSGLSVKADSSILNGETASYVISKGTLPSGLTLNSDGTISGSATCSAGTYAFSVTCTASSWLTSSADYSLTVLSSFEWNGDDVSKAQVGKSFTGYIESQTIATPAYTSVTYALSDGSLPAGLTLGSDGEISGTPTTSGAYKYTATITATKIVIIDFFGFQWPQSVTETYTYDGIINVAMAPTPTYIVTFNANGGTSEASQTVTSGSTAIVPSVITKAGYTFTGWYLDSSCTAVYDFNTPVTGNVTLYAGWIKDNSSDLTTLGNDISTITTNIGTLTNDVGTLTSDISVLKAEEQTAKTIGIVGIVLGGVGILSSVFACCLVFLKKKKD